MREIPAEKPLLDASDGLGAALRTAREARGLSVHKVAQDMHVSDDIIQALEHDDFAHLGAPIFVRGHLRNYAHLLGLPEAEVLAVEHNADKLAPPSLITLHPDGGRAFGRRFGMPIFSATIILVLMALAMVWWQRRTAEQPVAVGAEYGTTVTPQPVAMAAPATTISTTSAGSTDAAMLEAATTQSKTILPHRPASAPAEIKPTPRIKSAALPTARVNNAVTSVAGAGAAQSSQFTHAQFTLSQPSWIEVYDVSGKRLYYNLAPAGATLKVSGAGPLQVFLGNSPGVSIELNGMPFNLAPFTHPDNTARFRLGETAGNGGQAG